MTTLRRFLVIQSLLAWQGGFFFYATVVVPIGTNVLESAAHQGAITQRVSNWLNVFGGIALALLAVDQFATKTFRTSRWVTWFVLAVSLIFLCRLHPTLDALFDPAELSFHHRPTFKFLHGVYLWTCGIQWFAGLAAVWLTLRAWHVESKGAA